MSERTTDGPMPATSIERLTGVRVPSDVRATRMLPKGCHFYANIPKDLIHFDNKTLFYTAVQEPGSLCLRVFGPKFLNLRNVVCSALYYGDGIALEAPRLTSYRRYSVGEFDLYERVQSLSVSLGGGSQTMPVLHADKHTFAGLNVLYTQSKNNKLSWICDWVRFHHHHHGANALVLVDNGSTAYSLEELLDALCGLHLLKAIRVVSAPFAFGPSSAICSRSGRARFLQAAMLNIARHAYLSVARAVLICDVDELVMPLKDVSVFDACVASRFGFITFAGHWRFADPQLSDPRHIDHIWKDAARTERCPPKYAVDPRRFLGRRSWAVHSLESVPRDWFLRPNDFRFAHCQAISTGWQPGRDNPKKDIALFERDTVLNKLWQQMTP